MANNYDEAYRFARKFCDDFNIVMNNGQMSRFVDNLAAFRQAAQQKRAADATKPCANFQKARDGKCYNCGFSVKAHR